MTFPRNKKEINVEKLSEVINDNETGKQFYETSDKVISINKETPERISENFTYTNEELVEMQEWDSTLIDGLEDEPSLYVEDEWDNVHGDLIFFR